MKNDADIYTEDVELIYSAFFGFIFPSVVVFANKKMRQNYFNLWVFVVPKYTFDIFCLLGETSCKISHWKCGPLVEGKRSLISVLCEKTYVNTKESCSWHISHLHFGPCNSAHITLKNGNWQRQKIALRMERKTWKENPKSSLQMHIDRHL